IISIGILANSTSPQLARSRYPPDLVGEEITTEKLYFPRVQGEIRDSEGKAMATVAPAWEQISPASPIAGQSECWYAVQTRARHEKMVEQRLLERGVTTFLPLVTEVHRWSDRNKTVEIPLFNCYMFARLLPTNVDRLRVLRVDGVLGLVGA